MTSTTDAKSVKYVVLTLVEHGDDAQWLVAYHGDDRMDAERIAERERHRGREVVTAERVAGFSGSRS